MKEGNNSFSVFREIQATGKHAGEVARSAKQVRWAGAKAQLGPGWNRSTPDMEAWGCNMEKARGHAKPPDPVLLTPQTSRQERQSQRTQAEAAYFISIQLVKNNFTY